MVILVVFNSFKVVHERCKGVKVKLKWYDKIKCCTCESKETDRVKEFQGIELNGQLLEVVELNQSFEVA